MKITLKNVRLSYPALFSPKGFAGETDGPKKFSAAFILDKEEHADLIEQVEKAIKKVAAEKWGKKVPKYKGCLRDGDEKEEDGYGEDVMFISSSTTKRPPVVGKKLQTLAEEDDVIYAGCYVNATIDLWAQDNSYGKRVNAQLRAVQFWADGEAFGAAPVDPEDEFEVADDDEDNLGGL